MPDRQAHSNLVRIVEGVRGQIKMHMDLALRFDYGRTIPWVTSIPGGIRAVAGPNLAILQASIPVRGEDLKTVADFTIGAGKRASFVLVYGRSYEPPPEGIHAEKALDHTRAFWTRWSGKQKYKGPYGDAVQRSLITLKALTYRPTGGVVAAMTTSLPESLGGVRNWDYRFCWLRDTTFTLLALIHGGYYKEAEAWRDWLLRALAGSPDQIQIMYGLKGERQLVEWEVGWLPGYENSKPVRVGNAASLQVQLDIYGEMLDCFFQAQKHLSRGSKDGFRVLIKLMEHLETIWQFPDAGIWETRGETQQFTYSKVMAWVAFDRAVKLGNEHGFGDSIERWEKSRDTIHHQVCAKGWNEEKNAFTRAYGSRELDASLLLIPLVGFLPGDDPRVRSTVEAIERELMPNGLVERYDTSQVNDGLPPGEGVFLACSFWMVSCLKAIGRPSDARKLFERLLALRNDVGLLSEEFDVKAKRLVGNFPQAFSHIALVNAAVDLEVKD
jgi:GH15 family glucan-1,4-alpha-glucosidase